MYIVLCLYSIYILANKKCYLYSFLVLYSSLFSMQVVELNKMNYSTLVLCTLLTILIIKEGNCLHKRCIRCRSRGELGTCGDPFPFNASDPEAEFGIKAAACPSGWCGKIIDGTTGAFRTDDYGTATQRMCLQRPPNDYEERCAFTLWNYKKVYMCFCNGDLCNSSFKIASIPILSLLPIFITIFNFVYNL